MPEPDTFDLDAVFRALEHDIAGNSSPRGARSAIATARSRRRTTIGAVAAGIVLVAGGVAVGAGIQGHGRDAVPVDHLPAPAPFDGPHLTAATRGWTPAWGPQTAAGRQKLAQTFGGACLHLPAHGRGALLALADREDDVAVTAMSHYGSRTEQEAADWHRLVQQFAGCQGAEQISTFSDPSGALGHTYRIAPAPDDRAPGYVWLVSTGREIGVLKIFGQSSALPTDNDRPVAQVLLAAVQDPSSYARNRSTDQPVVRVDEKNFARALGSRHSGWQRSAGHGSPALASPCYSSRWLHGSWTSEHASLGSNGRQDVALFHSAAEARQAASSLVNALRSCQSAPYRATRSLDDARSMLVVASGPPVVWVAQHDDAVSVVRAPSGGTAPPRSVTVDVGGLMFAWMTAFSSGKG